MSAQVYPLKCRIRNEDTGITRIDVYDDIGEGGWFSEGLTAKAFTSTMASVKGPLEVHINSGGGEVFDGIAIGNAIRAHKGPVTTVVDGIAASIASVITQAGQERVMQRGSMLMIHDASGFEYGNADEMAKMAQTLDQVSGNLADIYAERCGGTADEWRTAMKAESWYTAEQAVAAGLADRVSDDQAELPAGMDIAAFRQVPGRIAARLRKMPQASAPRAAGPVIVAADGNHAPMTGSHSHGHPAYGSQGGDSTHAHDHSHDDDASHQHSHDDGGDEGDGASADDRTPREVRGRDGRILGVESMPLLDKAIAVHHTATVDTAWDGPAAVAAMPAEYAALHYCHAWQSADADASSHTPGDDDADDTKGNFKFPHHVKEGGPANLAACRNGLARLSSADIPAGDDAGVKAHLQAHLDDGGDADDHADLHLDLSGIDLEQLGNALKGALA
jgi:ATP-dependent protease ClpP protease subunit